MSSCFDVAIIGGGPAGIACALRLTKSNIRCCIIEREQTITWKPGEILDSKIVIPLMSLGIWDEFLRTGPLRATGTISSWGSDFLEKSSMLDPFGGAFYTDRKQFESTLCHAATHSGIQLYRNQGLQKCTRRPGHWELKTSQNKTFIANYLIEANGRGRSFSESSGRDDYDSLVALMAYIRLRRPTTDLRFYIEATQTGWAYVAPLPQNRMVIAFLTDAPYLPKGKKNNHRFFSDQIRRLRRFQNTCLEHTADVHIVSAKSSFRRKVFGENWLAIGDAAATYDPISGLGVISALNSGTMAADCLISNGFEKGGEIYAEHQKKVYNIYLQTRRNIYSIENRWPTERFWQCRHMAEPRALS